MPNLNLTPLFDIRTFGSLQEIRALDNFAENEPLPIAQYEKLIGDYVLPEKVYCCMEKDNGQLCQRAHNRGWVAQLKNGKITIVGNHCAKVKFGADSRLVSDTSKYENEKNRLAKLSALNEMLAEKSTRLEKLRVLRDQILALESRSKAFTDLAPVFRIP